MAKRKSEAAMAALMFELGVQAARIRHERMTRRVLTKSCRKCRQNRDRARKAKAAIVASKPDNNGLETDLMDLVAHLLHLAWFNGFDVDHIIDQARGHFNVEVHGGEHHGA